MVVEIDQSGKIEQTQLNTILALTNYFEYSLLLKKKDKRILKVVFRKNNQPKIFAYVVFAALISLIFKVYLPKNKVIIDKEYSGYEGFILILIRKYCLKLGIKVMPPIDFKSVGKESKAHLLAAKVAHRKIKPSKTVTLPEIEELIFRE